MSLASLAQKAKDSRGKVIKREPYRANKKPMITRENYCFDYNVNYRNVETFTVAKRLLATDVGEKYENVPILLN
jgi:hypothetical protein